MLSTPLFFFRATLLGAATGLRATGGFAAVVDRRGHGLVATLARPAATMGVGIELVLDKRTARSRLEPAGLAYRLAFGGLAACVLARSERRSPIPAVIVAWTGVLAAARAGHDVRVALSSRLSDPVVAVAEDSLALALAMLASD
jgi:hypothetical protein